MLAKSQSDAFEAFYDTARHNDVLEPKVTLMVHLAAAMALGCYP